MPLEDAFEVETPFEPGTTLGSLIDATFPPDPWDQREVRRLLDARANPDLPDMYDALVELLDHWRERRCDLRFYVNHGAETTLDARIGCWLAERDGAPPLVDLVIEQMATPLEYAVHQGYADDSSVVLRWLEETAVLFFLWRRPGTARICTTENAALAEVVHRLGGQGYLSICEGAVEVAPQGGQHMAQLIAEAESYVERYDLFSDVLPGAAPAPTGSVPDEASTCAFPSTRQRESTRSGPSSCCASTTPPWRRLPGQTGSARQPTPTSSGTSWRR